SCPRGPAGSGPAAGRRGRRPSAGGRGRGGRPRGFLETRRSKPGERPPGERVRDWREFEHLLPDAALKEQAARCMDCGVPYCHDGCPLTNLIPEWNDLVYQGRMEEAAASLHATNNFPEITGRVCPAPCEAS